MTCSHPRAATAALAALALVASVLPAAAQGHAGHEHAGHRAPASAPTGAEAEVVFLQHMMVHHAQAVEMTGLVPERAGSTGIRLLAERMQVSQEDEMAMMSHFLRDRGAELPGPHAHHSPEHAGMPGMISPERMARLRAARGEAFDRLFLELMIEHHEGALRMVEDLFATDGAAQDPEMFSLASHIDSDQRMEIDRMRRMLEAPSIGANPR